jgi:hypothetical protein
VDVDDHMIMRKKKVEEEYVEKSLRRKIERK